MILVLDKKYREKLRNLPLKHIIFILYIVLVGIMSVSILSCRNSATTYGVKEWSNALSLYAKKLSKTETAKEYIDATNTYRLHVKKFIKKLKLLEKRYPGTLSAKEIPKNSPLKSNTVEELRASYKNALKASAEAYKPSYESNKALERQLQMLNNMFSFLYK